MDNAPHSKESPFQSHSFRTLLINFTRLIEWHRRLVFCDAIEVALPAQEKLLAGQGRRGADGVVEAVDCQHLGSFVTMTHHLGDAFATE